MADRAHTVQPTDNVPDPAESGSAELARLFREHNASLVQLLRARLRSDQEAWDVAQEAYVRMLQLDRIGTVAYLRSYLFRTAFNIATDRLRSGAVRKACHRDPKFDLGVNELAPDRFTLAAEALSTVSATLKTLAPRTRHAFLLYRFDGLEIGDVARRMGVSERMVRYYVQQALSACRLALEERQP